MPQTLLVVIAAPQDRMRALSFTPHQLIPNANDTEVFLFNNIFIEVIESAGWPGVVELYALRSHNANRC